MKKSTKNKILNITFLVSVFLLITSLIIGIILLLNKNVYATICFVGAFCSLILCIITIKQSEKIESYKNYYCEEYREEVEKEKN